MCSRVWPTPTLEKCFAVFLIHILSISGSQARIDPQNFILSIVLDGRYWFSHKSWTQFRGKADSGSLGQISRQTLEAKRESVVSRNVSQESRFPEQELEISDCLQKR